MLRERVLLLRFVDSSPAPGEGSHQSSTVENDITFSKSDGMMKRSRSQGDASTFSPKEGQLTEEEGK